MGSFAELLRAVREVKDNKARWKREAILQYTPKTNNYCKDADLFIKELDVRIAQYTKDKIGSNNVRKIIAGGWLPILNPIRADLQVKFVQEDCAHKLEIKKAQETAGIIGTEVAKYEDDVLAGSGKESKQLFIIGGVVLLVALGIIMYSVKKK